MEALNTLLHGFGPVPAAVRADFSSLFGPLELRKRAYFVQAGERTTDIAFVESGVQRVCVTGPNGKEYTKTFLPNTSCWAYQALLTGQASALYIQALTPVRLQVAPYTAVETLYDQHPALERFARRLAEQFFVVKEQREIDLALLDAEARYQRLRKQHLTLEQRVAQHYIASHLGITPTQLSRIRARRG